MIPYWIVKPECYDFVNEIIGSVYSDDQIKDMKKNCGNGIFVVRIDITDGKYKHQYNNIIVLDRNVKENWVLQQVLTKQTIRKCKLKKIYEKNLPKIS